MLLVVFCCVAFLAPFVATQSYDKYQVLKVPFNGTEQLKDLLAFSDLIFADVWAVHPTHVDLMLSPQQRPIFNRRFGSLSWEVLVDNVQTHLDEHVKENEEARAKANQEVGFDFDYFPTTTEVNAWLLKQVAAHSGASSITIGKTYSGASIQGIKFGNSAANAKVFYIHCTIHAREWITTTSCLWVIDQLLNVDADRVALQKEFQFIIVPIHNVDGYDYTRTERLWRKNRQPNSGTTCVGTDLNRNYGFKWGGEGASTSPCSETYRGTAGWSAPESAAERTYLTDFSSRIVAYFDIHSYGGYFLSAWGYTATLPAHYKIMESVMAESVAAIRGSTTPSRNYVYGPSGNALYPTSGSTVDYLYGEYGVVNAYTIECYGTDFVAPVSFIEPIGKQIWAGVKTTAIQLIGK